MTIPHPTARRVLVCGGREFKDANLVSKVLAEVFTTQPNMVLACGGARGADALAERWGLVVGVPVCVYHADWKTHGRAAGPKRNQHMLENFKPDLVVEFPGGRGTKDMVRRARAARVPVLNAGRMAR